MVLRTSRRYNPEVDEVIFGDGTPVTRDSLCIAGLTRSYVNDMFQFSQKMSLLGVDNAEYSLLTAICIFSGKLLLVFVGSTLCLSKKASRHYMLIVIYLCIYFHANGGSPEANRQPFSLAVT
jgi:hypothetical protein